MRRTSQALSLLFFLFLFIQTQSKGKDELEYPVKIFLDIDPLIFLSLLLSSHHVEKGLLLSGITIGLTIIFGRFFCGWVCPLGTLNHLVGRLKKRPETTKEDLNLYRLKYYILFLLLVSSLFTLQITGIMDPISLLFRSFTFSVYPLLSLSMDSFFDLIFSLEIKGVNHALEKAQSWLKPGIFPLYRPYYYQGLLFALIFFLILSLNLVRRRFWCRYLCPLGALLGLLSRYSIWNRVQGEGCNQCARCLKGCEGGAIKGLEEGDTKWERSECLLCLNCSEDCPKGLVSFRGPYAPSSPDLKKRKILTWALSGALLVPLMRITPLSRPNYQSPFLIRPPGALEEREFLKRCIRCGECMKVCITNGLQPSLLEGGAEAIWTPILVPKVGYCEYNCTLCGQVCPTGAIKSLSREEKAKIKIGMAKIDKARCIPYAYGIPCIVCEEVCPLPKKAVWFEEAIMLTRDNIEVKVKQPRVDHELCIGCGICETKCPVRDLPAIYVTSIGESRSKEGFIL